MNGYTHKIGGTCAALVATCLALQEPFSTDKLIVAGCIVAAAGIGSLLPDIDHKNSTISKKHKITSWIMTHLFEHRGFTHAPLIQLMFLAILFYFGKNLGGIVQYAYLGTVIGLGIGLLSHTFLDWLTVGGIPLLYPFTKRKFHLMSLKTSKHSKGMAVFIVLLTIAIIGVKAYFVFLA